MGIPNTVMVAITELKHVAEQEAEYEGRVNAVMKAAVRHWMVTDEGEQFKAACGALILTTPDKAEEIKAQLRTLNALGAASSGIPVDWEALLEENKDAPKPSVMLQGAFREAIKARGY